MCSKSGVGLGNGMNTCGRRELPFPVDTSTWLLSSSELVRAAVPLLAAESQGNVSDENLSGDIDESSNDCMLCVLLERSLLVRLSMWSRTYHLT